MLFISPSIGETASPGSDVTAEIDHIAIRVFRDIVPLPVAIFIVRVFYPSLCNLCANIYRPISLEQRGRRIVSYCPLCGIYPYVTMAVISTASLGIGLL